MKPLIDIVPSLTTAALSRTGEGGVITRPDDPVSAWIILTVAAVFILFAVTSWMLREKREEKESVWSRRNRELGTGK